MRNERPASPKQVAFLKRLLTENGLYAGEYELMWKRLEAHEINERTPGDGTPLAMTTISTWLDDLLLELRLARTTPGVSRLPAPAARADTRPLVGPGVYRHDGELYVVKRNRAKSRCYAKRLIHSADRLTEGGYTVNFEFTYEPGAIARLAEDERVAINDEQVKTLLTAYGRCLCCGAHLKAAGSVARMVGPVCVKNFAPAAVPA